MDDQQRANYEAQSQKLRAELKQWENDWAKTSGGKKPAREDIKNNREIAQKYKEYNKLRDVLSGKIPPPAPRNDAEKQRKRKQEDVMLPPSTTPQKRTKRIQTPLKSQQHDDDDDDFPSAVTPSLSRRLFSPVMPTSIGPTPQKDGRVLGLFDLLTETPSRSTGGEPKTAPIHSTPSKRNSTEEDLLATPSVSRLGRTPNSSRNRNMLDDFMGITTPLHKRDSNSQSNKTPSSRSVSKLQFATPAFLRRTTAPLPPVDENGEWKVEPIKLPRKPLVRGLSSVVASLRKLEEEALDDELDAMREIEMESEPMFAAPRKANPPAAVPQTGDGPEKTGEAAPQAAGIQDATVIEEENNKQQRQEKPLLLGGFDDENLYDSQEEAQLDRGQPLRVFKKKGQKRTTRRVNMRPTRAKRPDTTTGQDGSSDEDDEGDIVPETQFDATRSAGRADDLLNDDSDPLSGSEFGSGSDFDENDNDDHDNDMKKKRKEKVTKLAQQDKGKKDKDKGKEKDKEKKGKGEGLVSKTVRKVKATAHANFKRLKLKNHGSKGGPGHNSRFRRRR